MMFRVHHGLADSAVAMDVEAALSIAKTMLLTGRTNILITAENREVTGRTDWENQPEDRTGTLVLEVAIK